MSSHSDKACDLFAGGFNCAQSVFAAFCDVTEMDKETALRLSSGFGAGMGRMREVCGACSAMFMIAGLLYGTGENFTFDEKTEHYKRIQELANQFKEVHGTIVCRELLKEMGRPIRQRGTYTVSYSGSQFFSIPHPERCRYQHEGC